MAWQWHDKACHFWHFLTPPKKISCQNHSFPPPFFGSNDFKPIFVFLPKIVSCFVASLSPPKNIPSKSGCQLIGSTMREVESLVPTSPLLAPRLNKTVLGSQPLPSSPPMSWVPAMASTTASSCDPVNASSLTLESGGPKLVVVLFGRPKAVVVVVCIWQIHLQPPKTKIELEHITLKAEVPHLNIIVAVGSGHWPLVVGFFWLIAYHILVMDSDKTTPVAIENGPFDDVFCFWTWGLYHCYLSLPEGFFGWTRNMLTCWNWHQSTPNLRRF